MIRSIWRLYEARRTFSGDTEAALERKAGATQSTFVEETSDECDAVGNTARRREFGQWISRIRSPIAARFPDFNEAGAQSERRMTGKIGDGEHFAAQRRHQKQVHLREQPGHL